MMAETPESQLANIGRLVQEYQTQRSRLESLRSTARSHSRSLISALRAVQQAADGEGTLPATLPRYDSFDTVSNTMREIASVRNELTRLAQRLQAHGIKVDFA